MSRDLRDPQELGEAYLQLREAGMSIDMAVKAPANPYRDGGFMSSNPADHHSRTPQNIGNLDDGGSL